MGGVSFSPSTFEDQLKLNFHKKEAQFCARQTGILMKSFLQSALMFLLFFYLLTKSHKLFYVFVRESKLEVKIGSFKITQQSTRLVFLGVFFSKIKPEGMQIL